MDIFITHTHIKEYISKLNKNICSQLKSDHDNKTIKKRKAIM